MNELVIHSIVMTAFVAFIILAAVPFVPGAEIGFALLLLFGGPIAPLVYLGMVCALLISYSVARLVPLPVLGATLSWFGLKKAATFVAELECVAPEARLDAVSALVPSRFGKNLLRYRYALLAVALNTPGNSLLGGGGGLAFVAGASRMFRFWPFLAVVICAVAPIPLIFFVI